MESCDREFQKMPFRAWLTCGMCKETKAGFLLILAGGLMLWFKSWELPALHVHAGYAVLLLGAVIQTCGLVRDLLLLAKRKKK